MTARVIPLRKRPKRAANETRGIVYPILSALARVPWCNSWRVNTGLLFGSDGSRVGAGSVGAADITGIVECHVLYVPGPITGGAMAEHVTVGRRVELEAKMPGKKPSEDQERYLEVIRSRGGFACVVHSVAEALEAVERARDPRCRQ